MTVPSSATEPVPGPLTPGADPTVATPEAGEEAPQQKVTFPLGWLLEHASPAIQYRAAADVARLPADTLREINWLPYAHRPAIRLAVAQSADGTWNDCMLAVPGRNPHDFSSVGTIPAVRRLLEYGWDRESPPIAQARRILFRLLAEDNDPNYLFELRPKTRDDDAVIRGRLVLREAAAAALAQAGYEADPRLRGAARRILERTDAFLNSPLAEKPFIRVGNQHVLSPEAHPPSLYSLTMLAHMPIFRQEQYTEIERIYEYLTRPLPRQEAIQFVGKKAVTQPHMVLGDMLPHRNAVESDVPFALMWLETMARLNLLKRNENWMKMYERFVDDRDRTGVWHPHKGSDTPTSSNPRVWPSFPLEDTTGTDRSADVRWADVTFRIGLIARLLGSDIELI